MVVPFITSMTMACFSTVCVEGDSASVSICWSETSCLWQEKPTGSIQMCLSSLRNSAGAWTKESFRCGILSPSALRSRGPQELDLGNLSFGGNVSTKVTFSFEASRTLPLDNH